MNAGQKCAATLACALACAPVMLVRAAPTEYTMLYGADPVIFQSSGMGRFIYDPKTGRVSDLVWDFGNGWKGALDESYPQDPNLGPVLLNSLETGISTTVTLTPPYITGPFSSVQWNQFGFPPYLFTRRQQPDLWGARSTHKRRMEVHSIFVDRFRKPSPSAWWSPSNGGWVCVGGTYRYATATAAETAISTVNSYDSEDPLGAATAVLAEDRPFWVSARVLNRSAIAGSGSGLVYSYQDTNNFNEVVLSALGTIELRQVRDGSAVTIAADGYEEGGQDLWVDVELRRSAGKTTVIVNGETIFKDVLQDTLAPGRVGLVAHRTMARFDDVRIARPLQSQPFKQTFDTAAPTGWIPVRGNWNVTSGRYVAPVQATAMSMSPARLPTDIRTFGFRARMLNPYGGAGNTIGLAYNGGQNEIVFTPSGEARINVLDESGRVVGTPYVGSALRSLRNTWFEVELSVEPLFGFGQPVTNIYVDGKLLFFDVLSARPDVGLVTHWSPGRFDDVAFRLTPFPRKHVDTFEYGALPPDAIVLSGAWERKEPGTLDSRAVGPRDLIVFPVPIGGDVDFVYATRLQNQYHNRGNWVGLVTNYNDDGDYYETLFSATGEVRVNKVVKGQVIAQATARHTVPPDKWFSVELRRTGTRTAVKVNGETILTNLPQGQIRGGYIGFVTHWSRGKFDDLRWQELK